MVNFKIIEDKKALSPVVATILLISMALVLAIIVFIWARSFITEEIEKFGEPIKNSCDDISFEADAVINNGNLDVDIVNRGNVPLYGIEVREKRIGTVKLTKISEQTLNIGEDGTFILDNSDGDFELGDNLIISPTILGETADFNKPYTCDEDFGVEVTVN
jgi:flagellin-like protein